MRKIIVILLVSLTLFTAFSITASSIKIWPGKLDYKINRWYSDGEKEEHARIQVTNTESYGISVTIRKDHPGMKVITKGYTRIPDLSWVKVIPEVLYIPAGSSDFFEVYIEVPENEQSLYYNEKWEIRVVVSPPLKSGGGLNIQTELAAKLFVKTPTGEAARIPYIFIVLGILFLIIILYIIHTYIKNKRSKLATYYFKRKK